jgi:hypothetical protein
MIEAPQSFVTRQECDKASSQNGFRREQGEVNGWRRYGSTTTQGSIWLAHDDAGSWLLALDHSGVIAELGVQPTQLDGPGFARFSFANLTQLYGVLPRVYQLAASLPDAPLREFQEKTKDLPRTTEAERLVVQRVGQEVFRDGLIDYWQGRCPLTGISDTALLRASHIIPWKDCPTDAERLDVHNGLLLSALWDAAFDRGLVTFNDDGRPVFSPALSASAVDELRWTKPVPLTEKHRERLTHHRSNIFKATG